MQDYQVKIKMIKNLRTPLQAVFHLMGSSVGVETKQKQNGKTPQYISHVPYTGVLPFCFCLVSTSLHEPIRGKQPVVGFINS